MTKDEELTAQLDEIIAQLGVSPGVAKGYRNKLAGMKTGQEKYLAGLRKQAESKDKPNTPKKDKKKYYKKPVVTKRKKEMSDSTEFTFDEAKFQEDLKGLFGEKIPSGASLEELKNLYTSGKGTFPSSLDKDKYTTTTTVEDPSPTKINEGGKVEDPKTNEEELGDYAKIAKVYKEWCETEKFAEDPNKDQPKRDFKYELPGDGTLKVTVEPTEAQKAADPDDKGSAVLYLSPKEMSVLEHNGVKPADRKYDYFVKDVEAAMATGSKTIEFGEIETEKFSTKLMGAVLEKGLRISNPPKSISLDAETTKGMSPETIQKMTSYALQNGIKMENAPTSLDFSQDFIKNLPEQEQYKVLATALRSGMKVENGPTQLKLTKEMIGEGQEAGSFNTEERDALRGYQVDLVKQRMENIHSIKDKKSLKDVHDSREPGKERSFTREDGTEKKLKVLTAEEKTAALKNIRGNNR